MKEFNTRRLFQLYLIDSSFDDRVKCFMDNWTVVSYRIPRDMVKATISDYPEIQGAGIYFLLGEDQSAKPRVYVGQASGRSDGGGLASRIINHDKETDEWWTDALLLTTVNDSWGPTELCYLENRFYGIANNAIKYDVVNSNKPPVGNPRIERIQGLEEVIEMARYFLGILGCEIFEYEGIRKDDGTIEPEKALKLVGCAKDCNATAYRMFDGKFVVLKGSRINADIEKSLQKTSPRIESERKRLANLIDGRNQLIENIPFKSASGASMFVSGTTQPGTRFWKSEDGRTLKDILNEENEGETK